MLLWWFLLIQVLLSSFTASLSSILVADKLYSTVNNLKVGYNAESFVYDYLKSNLNYKLENLVNIGTTNEFLVAFKEKTITAAYLELPYLRVFLSEHSNYMVNGESRTLGGFGFVSLFLYYSFYHYNVPAIHHVYKYMFVQIYACIPGHKYNTKDNC